MRRSPSVPQRCRRYYARRHRLQRYHLHTVDRNISISPPIVSIEEAHTHTGTRHRHRSTQHCANGQLCCRTVGGELKLTRELAIREPWGPRPVFEDRIALHPSLHSLWAQTSNPTLETSARPRGLGPSSETRGAATASKMRADRTPVRLPWQKGLLNGETLRGLECRSGAKQPRPEHHVGSRSARRTPPAAASGTSVEGAAARSRLTLILTLVFAERPDHFNYHYYQFQPGRPSLLRYFGSRTWRGAIG